MKIFLKYVLIITALILLYELNSGTLISDIKGLFSNTHEPNDLIKESGDIYFTIDTIPNEYKDILNIPKGNKGYSKNSGFQINGIMPDSLRAPILYLDYKKQFYIQIYKMSSSYNLSLNSAIQDTFVNSPIKNYGSFYSNEESSVNYDYKYLFLKPDTVILNIYGKQNKIILKNDSIAYYYSNLKNFAIKYRHSRKNNIYGETKDEGFFAGSNSNHPVELLFIKRNHSLYFFSMAASDLKDQPKFEPGLLYNLIKNHAHNN